MIWCLLFRRVLFRSGDGGCEAYTAIAWGVGLSHERSDIAGAEGFHSLEGNMCGTAMRGADALPGSKATSRRSEERRVGEECMSRRPRHVWEKEDSALEWDGAEQKRVERGQEAR